ncbi:DNA damage-inducible protein 1 [Achlya hypogyna]|uniref:DNA damage-inducible protein 1 n=1 Tax=Achlya hypogyna TaxID=1202772 RepID=A0A1V9YC23_ACHHY|nr:DNA damage-inducible protein 1 [Achlya hypogyna]
MQLTVTYEEHLLQVEVDAADPIENLKAIIEAEINLPMDRQILVLNGRQLNPDITVGQAGIQNNDLILVTSAAVAPAAPAINRLGMPAAQARAGMTLQDIPANCSAELLIDIMRLNPQLLRQVETGNPPMAEAIKSNNVSEVRMLLMKQHMEVAARKYQEEQELLAINANPFSEEAQAKIEEAIRLGNVQQNMEIAMEEMPEAFGRVCMLYIPTEVNGTPVKAFVDSGAQSTIMSSSCAERCGIMRLVDRRYAGQAVGVGTAKIIGRVHMAELKIGNIFYNCSFTILDQQVWHLNTSIGLTGTRTQGVDFLFGLDMLKRHQCCIDLHRNTLVLRDGAGSHEVSFLPEHEIPSGEIGAPQSPAPVPAAAPSMPTPAAPGLTPDQAAKVAQLEALGFPATPAVQALQSCNWNVDVAAGLLFENQ